MRASTLAATGGAVAATALAGGVAGSDADSPWYAALDKPAFQPPAAVFPVVWTALYADIAVTSAATLDRYRAEGDTRSAAAYRRALAANLVLNASWSWVFFRWHRLGPAVAVAAALTASSADLVRRAAATHPTAARALAPYAGWCAFATLLSGAIWRRNR
jgi:tryptophan-rich sensory protein